MDVTLDLPEDLIRKIRALNILTGGTSASFESTLIEIIQTSVSAQIVRSVSDAVYAEAQAQQVYTRPPVSRPAPRPGVVEVYTDDRDMTGVSAGLGDEDFDIELGPEEGLDEDDDEEAVRAVVRTPPKRAAVQAQTPAPAKKTRKPRKSKAATITDDEIEHDLEVLDPEHEAAAEAPTFADQMNEVAGEELFAQAAAFPVDPRRARRQRAAGATRAKVTPMLEEASETF